MQKIFFSIVGSKYFQLTASVCISIFSTYFKVLEGFLLFAHRVLDSIIGVVINEGDEVIISSNGVDLKRFNNVRLHEIKDFSGSEIFFIRDRSSMNLAIMHLLQDVLGDPLELRAAPLKIS